MHSPNLNYVFSDCRSTGLASRGAALHTSALEAPASSLTMTIGRARSDTPSTLGSALCGAHHLFFSSWKDFSCAHSIHSGFLVQWLATLFWAPCILEGFKQSFLMFPLDLECNAW